MDLCFWRSFPSWMDQLFRFPLAAQEKRANARRLSALALHAALLFAQRWAAVAGDEGRVLRAEAAVALDHRSATKFERIEGAVLLDAAADVLAGAPGAFVDIAVPPAE